MTEPTAAERTLARAIAASRPTGRGRGWIPRIGVLTWLLLAATLIIPLPGNRPLVPSDGDFPVVPLVVLALLVWLPPVSTIAARGGRGGDGAFLGLTLSAGLTAVAIGVAIEERFHPVVPVCLGLSAALQLIQAGFSRVSPSDSATSSLWLGAWSRGRSPLTQPDVDHGRDLLLERLCVQDDGDVARRGPLLAAAMAGVGVALLSLTAVWQTQPGTRSGSTAFAYGWQLTPEWTLIAAAALLLAVLLWVLLDSTHQSGRGRVVVAVLVGAGAVAASVGTMHAMAVGGVSGRFGSIEQAALPGVVGLVASAVAVGLLILNVGGRSRAWPLGTGLVAAALVGGLVLGPGSEYVEPAGDDVRVLLLPPGEIADFAGVEDAGISRFDMELEESDGTILLRGPNLGTDLYEVAEGRLLSASGSPDDVSASYLTIVGDAAVHLGILEGTVRHQPLGESGVDSLLVDARGDNIRGIATPVINGAPALVVESLEGDLLTASIEDLLDRAEPADLRDLRPLPVVIGYPLARLPIAGSDLTAGPVATRQLGELTVRPTPGAEGRAVLSSTDPVCGVNADPVASFFISREESVVGESLVAYDFSASSPTVDVVTVSVNGEQVAVGDFTFPTDQGITDALVTRQGHLVVLTDEGQVLQVDDALNSLEPAPPVPTGCLSVAQEPTPLPTTPIPSNDLVGTLVSVDGTRARLDRESGFLEVRTAEGTLVTSVDLTLSTTAIVADGTGGLWTLAALDDPQSGRRFCTKLIRVDARGQTRATGQNPCDVRDLWVSQGSVYLVRDARDRPELVRLGDTGRLEPVISADDLDGRTAVRGVAAIEDGRTLVLTSGELLLVEGDDVRRVAGGSDPSGRPLLLDVAQSTDRGTWDLSRAYVASGPAGEVLLASGGVLFAVRPDGSDGVDLIPLGTVPVADRFETIQGGLIFDEQIVSLPASGNTQGGQQ